MIIASDLDGVLCWNPLDKSLYKPYRLHEYYAQSIAAPCQRMHFQYIITARKIHFKKLTLQWLKDNNIKFERLLMFPNRIKKNFRNIVKFKANMINKFDIDIYYEDDVEIANYLKKNCPNTKIVFIRNNDLY